ncbi:MAG: hypothetical protein IKC36_01935 [Clostridia bacterium]|nr:hypothetical protein [Clostridia bacterium]
MKHLLILNLVLIAVIAIGLLCVKKYCKSERIKDVLLIVSAIFTVFCHYSSLLYHHFSDGTAMEYLTHNPNLILPIYPCNVVMWSCVVYGFLRDKNSRIGKFLSDYIFWFGIVSTLVGMFANVDFIRNPTLADFDVTKGIISHATLLFNVLLLAIFGHVKVNIKNNIIHIVISVVEMMVIGLYCNLVFRTLVSEEMAYEVNSMFLIHSPFGGLEFLTYPTIALIAIPAYFGLFAICELFAYKKGERFYNRFSKWIKERKENK